MISTNPADVKVGDTIEHQGAERVVSSITPVADSFVFGFEGAMAALFFPHDTVPVVTSAREERAA